MFVNAGAIVPMLKILVVLVSLAVFLLAAHGIWLARLACSPSVGRWGIAARIATVAVAAATPLLSYYAAEAAGEIRQRDRPTPLLLIAVAFTILLSLSAASVLLSWAGLWLPEDPAQSPPTLVPSGFVIVSVWLSALFMIVRVFSALSMPLSIAVVLAITGASLALISYPDACNEPAEGSPRWICGT